MQGCCLVLAFGHCSICGNGENSYRNNLNAFQVENGEQIFQEKVLRLYPTDDASYEESFKDEPLHCTIYEALCRHYNGIHFRERNAGPKIDEHMRDEGEKWRK